MPLAVRISSSALADLVGIRRWLTQPGAGPRAAARLRQIRGAIRNLATDAPMWPPGEHAGTRARTVAEHRIVYRIVADTENGGDRVDILRVFGPGQSRDRLKRGPAQRTPDADDGEP